jgi:structural maintenance of chromosome 3 (chondroitin sulfate proteoglycan 6)
VARREKALKSIRELGSIPADSLRQYRDMAEPELMIEFENINASLRKFQHVNKKALEQFVAAIEQQKQLDDRLEEVDIGKRAIEELINHLDLKKDEAIRLTFKSIARHFASVFAELVPGGKAQLMIQASSADRNAAEGAEDEDEGHEEEDLAEEEDDRDERDRGDRDLVSSERYKGIDIRVSFPASREVFSMNQLSGGQQAIVALSLIFAIQRCDPSPFYVFDEIDSNLDAVYRTAVAAMIERQSDSTQFICTSFRPEIVQAADKCFGVAYENKVSRVDEISVDDALAIISVVDRDEQPE